MGKEHHRYLERFIQGFWDNTLDAMFVIRVEPDGFVVDTANRAQLQELHIRVDDVAGRRIETLVPPDIARSVIANYHCCLLAEGPICYEESYAVKPGDVHHYFTQLVPIFDASGAVSHIVGISRNITEERLAQGALREAKARAEQMADEVQRLNARLMTANAELEARVVARTAELQKAKDAAESEARRDALTGCANRRHYFELLNAELARGQRYSHPFSVAMIDVDHFKSVNDRFGHDVGDKVLVGLVNTIQRVIRSVDSLGRLGGEEFSLLLPENTAEQARVLIERVRAQVAAMRVAEMHGDGITISVGIASYPAMGSNVRDLLRQADSAMYQAKEMGRDRIVIAR